MAVSVREIIPISNTRNQLKDFVHGRVVKGRLALGVLRHGQTLPEGVSQVLIPCWTEPPIGLWRCQAYALTAMSAPGLPTADATRRCGEGELCALSVCAESQDLPLTIHPPGPKVFEVVLP